jgi:predicted nucleic acid-binding protein
VAQVIDASVAVAWCAPNQATALTRASLKAVIEDGGHVPAQFWFEVLYSIDRLERRSIVTRTEADEFVELLATLPLTIATALGSSDMLRLHAIARRYDVKIYDAAYLQLALQMELPLATRDDVLARAAEQAGAIVFTAETK